MPRYGKAEIRNLTKVIESGSFADKRGGFMDKFRTDFAKALRRISRGWHQPTSAACSYDNCSQSFNSPNVLGVHCP